MKLGNACALAVILGATSLVVTRAHADEKMEALPPPSAPSPGASAAGPDASAPAPKPVDEAEAARKMRVAFRGAAGFQYARVFGVPVTGARLRLGAGGQNDTSGHYGSLSVMYAETENDLRTWDVRFGWIGDFYRASIVRLGIDFGERSTTVAVDQTHQIVVGPGCHA